MKPTSLFLSHYLRCFFSTKWQGPVLLISHSWRHKSSQTKIAVREKVCETGNDRQRSANWFINKQLVDSYDELGNQQQSQFH